MNYKDKKKLTSIDAQKINTRYNLKLQEYEPLSLDELKDLYQTKKMSSTDRQAIVYIADVKMKQLMVEQDKLKDFEERKQLLEGE